MICKLQEEYYIQICITSGELASHKWCIFVIFLKQFSNNTFFRPDAEQTKEPAQKFSLKQKFQVVVNKQLQIFKKMKIKEIFGSIN